MYEFPRLPPIREIARDEIKSSVRRFAGASVAENTSDAYDTRWNAYLNHAKSINHAPSDTECVTCYLAHLASKGRAVATIRLTLAAINFMFALHGKPKPGDQPEVATVMKGIARECGKRQRQVAPLTDEIFETITDALPADVSGLRDRAMLAVMRDGMLRASEVAQAQVADLTTDYDGSGFLFLRKSKSDQISAGEIVYMSAATIAFVIEWLKASSVAHGALFRAIDRHMNVAASAMTPHSIRRIVKRAVHVGNQDPAIFSGHSCRVGMSHDLVETGTEMPALMVAGRWSSATMPSRYTRSLALKKGAVALYHGAKNQETKTPDGRAE